MRSVKTIMLAALLILCASALIPAGAAVQTTSLEIRGQTANETAGSNGYLDLSSGSVYWHPQNFAGFVYYLAEEIGREQLTILNTDSLKNTRTIPTDNLVYSTQGENKMLLVVQNAFGGDYSAAAAAGLEQFQAGSMSSEDGKYKIVGWQAGKYVGIKNKTNKLAKLVLEHTAAASDKKTLTLGETWDIGAGWQLNVTEINVTSSPRYARLNISKNGITKKDSIVYQRNISTYVEKSIAGETDVPMFVTFVDSIFAGATTNMTQLRYTWVLDTNITEVRTGDQFGVFTATTADASIIELKNALYKVSLCRDCIMDLMGSIRFKVADSDTLRFYPVVRLTVPGIYEVRGQTANETSGSRGYLSLSGGQVSWLAQNFAGFFYDINDELGKENLTILDSGSLIGTRTIAKDKLVYTTGPDNKMLNVVKYAFNGDCGAAILVGLEQFQAGSMSSECGKYKIIGWQAEKYVGIKDKTNKLSRLIIEHGPSSSEKKTLSVGESWDIGKGWTLKAVAIDAKAIPRQVWFELSKDGTKKDDKVVPQGYIYTYVEKSIAGETDVPVFVTYVDSIFAGAYSDMVQVRYTWAIDTSVTQINAGDMFGVFKATTVAPWMIQLKNTDTSVTLSRDSTVDLMGSMKFRVADSDTLRFYPGVDAEVILPPTPQCYNSTINGNVFRDNNVNGFRDLGEPGLTGWTIRLKGKDSCSNSIITRTALTGIKGNFEFKNVTTGTYYVSEKIPVGWIPTTSGIYNVSVPSFMTTITRNFGNIYWP